ncbi:MAG TPA: outer membrane protein assembly factor BamA, partial [Methylomirabilota bacterium]|nr:outer membrane protein assembly factor BamA [Methylomirabilota bacterium]
VNRGADKLKEFYETEGYFEVGVTPEVEKLPDGDVTVTYRIAEGRRITIDQIVIEGAQGLTPKQVKGAMDTQEREYIILRGTVQRQKLDEDVDRIIQLYNDSGYVQARVESSEIQVDREKARATIRIVVVEGPQFKVGGVDVTGNAVLPIEEIRKRIELKTGDVFSRAMLRDTVKGITDLYSAVGRASADVTPNTLQDIPGRLVNIVFEINEGPETYVERINISGNTRSEEKILRREIPMAEGDLFTSQKLARAKQKLTNLNYFDKVEAKTAPGSAKDRIIVNIDVTEKPTGLFSIGGGYSSQDGALGTLDLSQNNFLGRGWQVFLRVRGGASTQQGTIGFTEPWLFDRPLAAGFDLFNNRRIYNDYTINSLGGDVRVGHPLGDYARWNLIYKLEQDDLTGVNPNASPELRDAKGTTITSVLGGNIGRDTRDNLIEPTKGNLSTIGADFAGILTEDNRYVRLSASTVQHQSLWFSHVLSGRVGVGYEVGWSNKPVPIFERFYLGGPNSVRSFKLRQISPRDDSGTRIGGNFQVLGNVEYTIPTYYGVRLALFFDAGNVYGPDNHLGQKIDLTNLKYAVGMGLRWNSPFGPIRIDYGVNPDPKPGDKFGEFHFAVGTAF